MEYLLSLEQELNINLIGHSVCRENWNITNRVSEDYELIVVYRGNLMCKIGEISQLLKEGEACLIPPNILHEQRCNGESCRFFYTHFSCGNKVVSDENRKEILNDLQRRPILPKENVFFLQPENSDVADILLNQWISCGIYKDEIFTLFEKALIERNHNHVGRMLLIRSYVSHILILLSRQYLANIPGKQESSAEQKKLVQDAVFYIQNHYTEPLQVSTLSQNLLISQQYLSRLFRMEFDMSPIKFINQLRIEHAKELIRSSNANLSEIAFQVGFDNVYYFSRVFKQYEGFSPSVYRLWLNSQSNQ